MEHEDGVLGALFLPDVEGGGRVLTWSAKSLRLWDPATGTATGPRMMHDGAVNGVHWLPDFPGGARVMSWSDDRTVRLWDPATGTEASPRMVN